MAAFTVLWLGQVLSTVGTRMTNFVLGIWVWQRTGKASDLALLIFAAFAATVVFSPLAGSFVDRWSRRLTIMISDLGSAATTLVTLVLFLTGAVELWQLVIVNAVTGAFLAFQAPAYGAAIAAMMPKEHYARANGMMSLVRSVPVVFAPALAGGLLSVTSISTVILVDLVSYLVAIGTVFLVTLPPLPRAEERKPISLWRDSLVGLRYIASHRGLAGMQAMLFVVGLLSAMGYLVLTPLVLSRSPHGHGEAALGLVQSVGAVGGVLGALVLGALKSPSNKMARVLLGILVFSVLGRIVLGVGDTLVLWTFAWFCSWLCVPFIEGYSMAIWQEKVAPAIQGRVFAASQLVQQLALLQDVELLRNLDLFEGKPADAAQAPDGGTVSPQQAPPKQ
jgi:MFS family permease